MEIFLLLKNTRKVRSIYWFLQCHVGCEPFIFEYYKKMMMMEMRKKEAGKVEGINESKNGNFGEGEKQSGW